MLHGCARWRAVAWLVVAACIPAGWLIGTRGSGSSIVETCTDSAAQGSPNAAYLCAGAFLITGDVATGVRAARALERADQAVGLVALIAARIGDQPSGANAWAAVAAMALARGDAAGALVALDRATTHRSAADRAGWIDDALARAYAHLLQIDFLTATTHLARAYELASQVPDPEQRVEVSVVIAGRLLQIGDTRGARNALDEAKRIASSDGKQRGRLLGLEASLDGLEGQWRSARSELLEAIEITHRNGDTKYEGAWRINLVEVETELGNFAAAQAEVDHVKRTYPLRAIVYYEAKLRVARGEYAAAARLLEHALAEPSHVDTATLKALYGRVLIALDDPAGGEVQLVEAIRAYEAQRDKSQLDMFKSLLLAKRRDPFEDLFALRVEQGRVSEALAVAQQMKARSMFEGLVAQPSSPRDARTAVLEAPRLVATNRKVAGLARVSPTVALPQLDTVIARLRGRTVLTYMRARDSLWGVVITAEGALRVRRLGTIADLKPALEALQQNPSDERIAARVGDILLPDELLPPAGSELFIVSDDLVSDVAFPALRKHGEFVIDRNALAHIPSATILAMPDAHTATHGTLVIGDPTNDRPAARAEASEVAKTLNVVAAIGDQATMKAVLTAGAIDVLHIASHADATPEGPALRMSDGELLGTAVIERRVGPRLVVLTGCSSGYAAQQRDEFGSVAAAFLAAGAHAVVASRIDVDDDVARRFARLFYEAGGIRDPIAAVAVAQRQLRREGVALAQWSTFMVFGGLRPPS